MQRKHRERVSKNMWGGFVWKGEATDLKNEFNVCDTVTATDIRASMSV